MRRASLLVVVLAVAMGMALASCGKNDTTTNHEGNIGSPVIVTVGTTHVGTVGGDAGDDTSYYAFVATSTYHTISLNNPTADLAWHLYSDANYTALVQYCDNYSVVAAESCTATGLTVGNTYYLSVYNKDLATANFNLLVN